MVLFKGKKVGYSTQNFMKNIPNGIESTITISKSDYSECKCVFLDSKEISGMVYRVLPFTNNNNTCRYLPDLLIYRNECSRKCVVFTFNSRPFFVGQ